MSTQFAIDATQQIVHISEVQRGLNCACTCIVCNESMVAKKGAEREHHFAHESNKAECIPCHETVLHRFAKREIQKAMGLTVPDMLTGSRLLAFERVEEETILNDQALRPDIIGYTNEEKILVEIAYSSFADELKKAKLAEHKLKAVEIDLHDFPPEQFDPIAVTHAVCHAVDRKTWLYPLNPIAGRPRWTVTVRGMYVNGYRLPSGDLTIKSRYHPEVVAIIGNIARQCQGRWDKSYKNWIVPYLFTDKAEQLVITIADPGSF